MANKPVEIVIYIHGVSNDLRGRSHDAEYQMIHKGIGKNKTHWPNNYLGVEWGWHHGSNNPKSHELLTDAQRILGGRVMPAVDRQWDFTLNPARSVINAFRPLMLYGFGDIFYYVSEDGKFAVRETVARQILDHISSRADDNQPVSLTLVGHSAGAVVAFDFLFALFRTDIAEDESARAANHYMGGHAKAVSQAFTALREKQENDKLRLRRLFTFGAPITPLACRSDAVLEILAGGDLLKPEDYGLTKNPFGTLKGPRWVNIWDRDDPIAWPVEPLMNEVDGAVKDEYVDVSDLVTHVHEAYWESKEVHQKLAEYW